MAQLDVTDPDQLLAAAKSLARRCPVIKVAVKAVGAPPWRTRPGGYAGLGRIIAFQQVSTAAASTIWGRVETYLGKVTARAVLAADPDDLRACGLSRPKVSHLRSIAEAEVSGDLNFRRLARSDDDAARAEMVAVKGVGPWTADVYLMFCLGRSDVFPHADIGLSEAWRQIRGDAERPPPRDFLEIGERWRPHRGVAAHLLWSWINAQRSAARGGA